MTQSSNARSLKWRPLLFRLDNIAAKHDKSKKNKGKELSRQNNNNNEKRQNI